MPNALTDTRDRGDQCPGIARPWAAPDGLLVRLRLIGGRISAAALRSVAQVAGTYGDGFVHVTSRANLQLRGFPGADGRLTASARAALEATGLLPSAGHELVRNVMVSPRTGLAGGMDDLRPVADELDALICARPELAGLPGKFLFVLDDGHGDLVGRWCDLGIAATGPGRVQLRVGTGWGPVVPVDRAAAELADLAIQFQTRRGTGPDAPWHVAELDVSLTTPAPADPGVPAPVAPDPYGTIPGGRHIPVPSAGLDADMIGELATESAEVIVTPWRGVLIPEEAHD